MYAYYICLYFLHYNAFDYLIPGLELTSLFYGEVGQAVANKVRFHGKGGGDGEGGVPVFNHEDAREWLYKRAMYVSGNGADTKME